MVGNIAVHILEHSFEVCPPRHHVEVALLLPFSGLCSTKCRRAAPNLCWIPARACRGAASHGRSPKAIIPQGRGRPFSRQMPAKLRHRVDDISVDGGLVLGQPTVFLKILQSITLLSTKLMW